MDIDRHFAEPARVFGEAWAGGRNRAAIVPCGEGDVPSGAAKKSGGHADGEGRERAATRDAREIAQKTHRAGDTLRAIVLRVRNAREDPPSRSSGSRSQ